MSKQDIKGVAQLCFLEDDSCFYGNVITVNRGQYGLIGRKSHTPCDDAHECCFESTPDFYDITVIDHGALETENETTLYHIVKTGGDNCTLSSKDFNFCTDQLYVDSKADEIITKYFTPNLAGNNCYICMGEIEMKVTKN